MKIKKCLSLFLMLLTITVNAQIKLESTGKVIVGLSTFSALSQFDVRSNGSAGPTEIKVYNVNGSRAILWALSSQMSYGFGVNGTTGQIYVSSTSNPLMTFLSSGNVGIGTTTPGYKLDISGSAHCTGNVWTSSDSRFKKNIKSIESPLEKIMKINGKTYEFKKEEFKNYNFNEGSNFGFIAQELKEVLPEAVKLEENGYYSVNYDAIIPVLVEAMKEQNLKIKILESQLPLSSYEKNSMQANAPQLMQNNPNPFNHQTNIQYYLPPETKSASLMIFDLQGKLIKTFNISEYGNASMIINANELSAGMFIYSLIVDEKVVNTKRMIMTN